MATQREIYNIALRHLGERPLGTTETNTTSRALDAAWSGAIAYMLESGFWNWSIRTVAIYNDEDTEPRFGFQYAFTKPDDWVRTVQLAEDENFRVPLETFEDEVTFWFANADPIFIRYVSNDAAYGSDLGKWTASFSEAIGAYLAHLLSPQITANKGDRNDNYQLFQKLLKEAKSRDAMNEPSRRLPAGNWTRSRLNGVSNRRYDRF